MNNSQHFYYLISAIYLTSMMANEYILKNLVIAALIFSLFIIFTKVQQTIASNRNKRRSKKRKTAFWHIKNR